MLHCLCENEMGPLLCDYYIMVTLIKYIIETMVATGIKLGVDIL